MENLLLKTAFSCMACDGDIDSQEVELIKKLHNEHQIFGDIDIDKELNALLEKIKTDGKQFLKNYFTELTSSDLSESEELKLVEVAIETIKADDKIEYSEIKFFKLIWSKLKIDGEKVIEKHPDFEDYLEDDIFSESYLSQFFDGFDSVGNISSFKELNFDDLKG